jgi:glycosyltransferase involved in cell wall biosynthesis
VYARRFEQRAKETAAPDVIIASNPPLESPVVAGRIARARGAKLIVDVQDIWIDNFRQLMPAGIRWAWPLLLRPWRNANRQAYLMADAVVGVAGGYADEPRRYGRSDYRREVIPLGIDLAAFDAAVHRGRCLLGEKPTGEIWVAYSGSYSHAYDVLTIAEVARRVVRERSDVRLIFTGRGELEKRVREITRGLDRVTFLGFAPFDDWAATLANCDIGWNAVRPEALVLMPNKVFYYWASGLAVLNSIPGECAEWVSRTGTGLSYSAGDVDAASAALLELVCDRARLARQREASRREAVERWDRRRLYQTYIDLVSELSARGR